MIGHHSFVSFGEYAYALALLLVPVAVEVFSVIQVNKLAHKYMILSFRYLYY
jgi:hypothetical protein